VLAGFGAGAGCRGRGRATVAGRTGCAGFGRATGATVFVFGVERDGAACETGFGRGAARCEVEGGVVRASVVDAGFGKGDSPCNDTGGVVRASVGAASPDATGSGVAILVVAGATVKATASAVSATRRTLQGGRRRLRIAHGGGRMGGSGRRVGAGPAVWNDGPSADTAMRGRRSPAGDCAAPAFTWISSAFPAGSLHKRAAVRHR
jgi:hypothetical protein